MVASFSSVTTLTRPSLSVTSCWTAWPPGTHWSDYARTVWSQSPSDSSRSPAYIISASSTRYVLLSKGPQHLVNRQHIKLRLRAIYNHSSVVLEALPRYKQVLAEVVSLAHDVLTTEAWVALHFDPSINHDEQTWIFQSVVLHLVEFEDMLLQ